MNIFNLSEPQIRIFTEPPTAAVGPLYHSNPDALLISDINLSVPHLSTQSFSYQPNATRAVVRKSLEACRQLTAPAPAFPANGVARRPTCDAQLHTSISSFFGQACGLSRSLLVGRLKSGSLVPCSFFAPCILGVWCVVSNRFLLTLIRNVFCFFFFSERVWDN